MEQVFFNVPLSKLEPIFKRWIKEAQAETEQIKSEYQKTNEQLLTIEQAAEFLTLSKATLYSKVSLKTIPYMKRAKRLYFSKSELMDYIKEGRHKTLSEMEEEAGSYLVNKKGLK